MATATSYPAVVPMLHYQDVGAAVEWLTRVCGFHERMRLENPDGSPGFAEMEVEDGGLIMVSGVYEEAQSPNMLGGNTVLMYVLVEDVDAHHARSSGAGAEITELPADQDYGHRRYSLRDPEGYRWAFAQPIADSEADG
jgi:uncharacterized glyoxalase superfamily protein PhnB